MDNVFYILLVLLVLSMFLDRFKKEKKTFYISNTVILLIVSGFFFLASIPNLRSNQMPDRGKKKCFTRQEKLNSAIKRYNTDNKLLFPENCTNSNDFIQYQKDYLIKNGYLQSVVQSYGNCFYKIENSNLYCIDHGSFDSNSSFYTDGFPVNDNGEIKNEFLKSVKEVEKKLSDQRKRESDAFKLSILLLVAAIKSLIFSIRCFI